MLIREGTSGRSPDRGRTSQPRIEGEQRLWAILSASLVGLLLAIATASVVAILANERVRQITDRAIGYDIEIEDEGDDLRAAVLELRHHHRDIVFGGPSDSALADLDGAYAALLEEIGDLEELGVNGLEITQPAELRRLAETYYADFRPAVELRATDPDGFARASEAGLARISEMGTAADELDTLGEALAANSLSRVNRAAATERLVLYVVLGGVVLMWAALAFLTRLVLARLRVAAEREQQANRELARLLQTKNDFIADASHELRTPLTVILGNAEIGLATPGERLHREVLEDIAAEAGRMGRLVEDLLFLARSDAGMPPLEKEYVPVRWLIARLARPAESLAKQRGACLTADLTGEGFLEADPTRVEQAVLVLVDNAARYSPAGSCVELTARVDDRELAIEVEDAGPGIPLDDLPQIFDRFYQVGDRRTRKKGGSGLGLSIAKSIVLAHGGSIAVHSRPNQGTRLTIRLPLVAAARPAVESEGQTVAG